MLHPARFGRSHFTMRNDSPLIGRQATLSENSWDRRFAGWSAVIETDFGDGSLMVFVAIDSPAKRAGYRLLVSEGELVNMAG
jgi:hypothetical protein